MKCVVIIEIWYYTEVRRLRPLKGLARGPFFVGVGIRAPDTVFLGFGLEGIATAEDRAAVMDRVLGYLD